MALKVLQSGMMPLGQFDGIDSQYTTVKGGEVVSLQYFNISSTDKHAKDVDDGYVSSSNKIRPALTPVLQPAYRPLMLCDDGTTGYGTLFGQIVGGAVGQVVTGGTALGPHSAAGSGKLTAWDKPGLYAVTLDACDTTAATGLQPTNTTIGGSAALYASTAGLLTPNVSNSFEAVVVGRFIEFTSNGSLVNTPVSLVAALNSPSGGGAAANPFTQAVFRFEVET